MSIWITLQGLAATAMVVAITLGLRAAGDDPHCGGDRERTDLLARVSRCWAAIVEAHEAHLDRLHRGT